MKDAPGIRLRFIARDLNGGSIVEAGVDDLSIEYVTCGVPGDVTGDGELHWWIGIVRARPP